MSDYMSAEITLGNKVPSRLVKRLCKAIAAEEAALDWGNAAFRPTSPDELLAARRVRQGRLILTLYAEQARWGEFQALEEFLQRHGIAYCRRSEGQYEYDPEIVEFRPECGLIHRMANHSGEPVVSLDVLREAEAAMQEATRRLGKSHFTAAQRVLRHGLQALGQHVPRMPPPLDTFEIIPNTHKETP